ncbi:MAG: DUF370 domain-containing protein [Firmicutes bacterium]|nr:DUF370 domain-containing protein [Bacillota bacterium]
MVNARLKLINVGFGNTVPAGRIVAIVGNDSLPIKRSIADAKERKLIIDATQGRKTRAVIFTDSGHVVLSALQPETIANRFTSSPEEPANRSVSSADEADEV